MDLAEAQAAASSEGLVLVRGAGCASGFKGVYANGGGYRGCCGRRGSDSGSIDGGSIGDGSDSGSIDGTGLRNGRSHI